MPPGRGKTHLLRDGAVAREGASANAYVALPQCAMSKLLLNLRNVPEDEADDVRDLLDANGIAFYETPPSMWGISAGGIFVTHDAAIAEAKRLMAAYQQQRQIRVRAEHAAAVRDGTADSFRSQLRREPLRVALAVLGIVAALALLFVVPFVLMR